MARALIKFNRADLRKNYSNPHDCPIFSAMDRAGVPVVEVVSAGFEVPDDTSAIDTEYHYFSKTLRKVSDLLCRTNKNLVGFRGRGKLLGKRFLVTW